jgi:hypothetical protein
LSDEWLHRHVLMGRTTEQMQTALQEEIEDDTLTRGSTREDRECMFVLRPFGRSTLRPCITGHSFGLVSMTMTTLKPHGAMGNVVRRKCG